MTPEEQFANVLRTLETQIETAGEAWVAETVEAVKAEAQRLWPNRPPEHPYARQRSQFRFVAEARGLQGEVRNEADYSGYVEEGYTKQGARTAKPYHARGGRDYVAGHTLTDEFRQERRDALVKHLEESIHG